MIFQCYLEDLTRVVISYEIYETSLRRVSLISYELTASVRFCLSYDPLKWDFIAFKMNIVAIRKRTVDMKLSMTLVYAIKCYYTCGHTIFMTRRNPLINSDVIG